MIEDLQNYSLVSRDENGYLEVLFTREPTFFQWLFRIRPRTKVFVQPECNAVQWFNKFDGSPASPDICALCNMIQDASLP